MIQTWILLRDQSPVTAVAEGNDASICGDCRHRGTGNRDRSCYVNVGQAPQSVWRAFHRDGYAPIPDLGELARRPLRLGSYGDPAAVPVELVLSWASAAAGDSGTPQHTGYTQQWRTCDQRLRNACMASVDSEPDQRIAESLGWRTFRVRESDSDATLEREVVCPASAERGNILTCAECLACGGAGSGRRGHITIRVHGAASRVTSFDNRFKGIEVRVAA